MGLDVTALYVRYGGFVFRRCRQLLANDQWAAELTQDTFVMLCRKHETLSDLAPSALLHQIATRLCLNAIRDSRVDAMGYRHDTTSDLGAHRIVDSKNNPEAIAIAKNLLASLPEEDSYLAALYFLDGCTFAELSELTRLSISGVRKKILRLQHLLSELESSVEGSGRVAAISSPMSKGVEPC